MKRVEQISMELATALSLQDKQPISYSEWVQDKGPLLWSPVREIASEVPELLRWSVQVRLSNGGDKRVWHEVEVQMLYEVADQNDWRSKKEFTRVQARFGVPLDALEPTKCQWFWIDFAKDFTYWLEKGYFISKLKMKARVCQPQPSSWHYLTIPVRISLG